MHRKLSRDLKSQDLATLLIEDYFEIGTLKQKKLLQLHGLVNEAKRNNIFMIYSPHRARTFTEICLGFFKNITALFRK